MMAVPAVLAVLEVAEEVGVGLDDGPFRAHLVILAAAWWAGHYRCPVRNCLNQCAGNIPPATVLPSPYMPVPAEEMGMAVSVWPVMPSPLSTTAPPATERFRLVSLCLPVPTQSEARVYQREEVDND